MVESHATADSLRILTNKHNTILIREQVDILREQVSAFPGEGFEERLEKVSMDFMLMRNFMLQGIDDPQRNVLYQKIKHTLENIRYDLSVRRMIEDRSIFQQYKRFLLNHDFSVQALDVLLATAANETAHCEVLSKAFVFLLASYHWRETDRDEWTRFLLSENVREADRALLVSALSLSVNENYSREKTECLAYVSKASDSVLISQRAFIGYMLGIAQRPVNEAINETSSVDVVSNKEAGDAESVMELYMQMLSCSNVDKDSKEIRENLMPNIVKNQPFVITRRGIIDRDDLKNSADYDPESDDREEKGMEAMEQSIRRMLEKQKSGADIFFDGFSQMKRFPFFRKVENWFVPFYKEHPDISDIPAEIKNGKFVDMVTKRGPFCESDKYSFVIAMSSVMRQVPENMRQMMENGEMGPLGMQPEGAENRTPSFIRLQCLQDLYRFFRLNNLAQQLHNPFKGDLDECLILMNVLDRFSDTEKKSLCLFLLKKYAEKQQENQIRRVLDSFDDKDSYDYNFCKAEFCIAIADWSGAVDVYNKCLGMKPNNPAVMRGLAKAYYYSGEYGKAAFMYDALHTLYPEREGYLHNYAMCQVMAGKAEDVLNDIFRLDYEHPDDRSIKNLLGWALMYAGRKEQALTTLLAMDQSQKLSTSETMNLAYAYIINNKISDAVKVLSSVPPNEREKYMTEDAPLLKLYGLGEAEIEILCTE